VCRGRAALSAGWVAGSTRARLLLTRRLGVERAGLVAASGSLAEGLAMLPGTRFAAAATAGDPESAQRLVASCLLLDLRLLAGWSPAGAGEPIRSFAGWFEMVNVEDRLAYLTGADMVAPHVLGSLLSAWPQAVRAGSAGELRAALRGSAWGDPGGDSPQAIHLGLRVGWARRVARAVPEARSWAAGALALLVARERFLIARPADELLALRPRELGSGWAQARTLAEFAAAIPARASWPLAGATEPQELWRLEAGWWRQVSADAEALVRGSREGRAVIVGVVALLAADAVRTSAALAAAAGSSAAAREAFDALV
jgi:hypothetical protein